VQGERVVDPVAEERDPTAAAPLGAYDSGLVLDEAGLGEGGEGLAAEGGVGGEAFDVEQTPVGGEADLRQGGQVARPGGAIPKSPVSLMVASGCVARGLLCGTA
jgi:hypothetical protein